MSTRLRKNWEYRADESGSQLSGVLFRGLSHEANSAMHDWHSWLVKNIFLPGIPKEGRVLDLGCGYGRLSRLINMERPDIEIIGQDLASGYCRLFRRDIGSCIQADAIQLPFVTGSFDGVLAITCLMYIERLRVPELLRTLHTLLRSRGKIFILDPGMELQSLITFLRRAHSVSPTGGSGFKLSEYQQLVRGNGFSITACGGNPHLSRLLLLPGMACSQAQWFLARVRQGMASDCRDSGYAWTALHRWVAGQCDIPT